MKPLQGMQIGDVRFSSYVLNSSGARGFDGRRYPLPHPGVLVDWRDSVFVSKTITYLPREGNLPLRRDLLTPRERFPKSILVDLIGGHVLNCVGLTNPGAKFHLDNARIRYRREPFVISFIALSPTRESRMEDLRRFLDLFVSETEHFSSEVVLEINVSSPNSGHDPAKLVAEATEMLDIVSVFGLRVIFNINLLVSPYEAVAISEHPACAAVSQSNAVPWGACPDRIPWKMLYGEMSPLIRRGFGPGGYSGPYALPILEHWIEQARSLQGNRRWLIAGGGIQSADDADRICRIGAGALLGLKIGVVCIVRPWRVKQIIKTVNRHFRYIDRAVHLEGSK